MNTTTKSELPNLALRPLGRTGLKTTTLGFGSYRVGVDEPEHRTSLELALQKGCNLIDTSTNYADGDSETVIGWALKDLFSANTMKRGDVILVTKVGYVQGKNMEQAKSRQAIGKGFDDMVKYNPDCWHCIHPDFIADQLSRSLARLGVDKVDVLLLHNPEYFFSDLVQKGQGKDAEKNRKEFYDRIRMAFQHLESEVKSGRIDWYGVSSNTFVKETEDPEFTSITAMWEIAREIGGENHHFAVLQMPANLFEGGAVLEKNNGADETQTPLEFATEKNLGVLINRPLNAILENHLFRLADYHFEKSPKSVAELSDHAITLEQEFNQTIAPNIQTEPESGPPTDFFRWAEQLEKSGMETIAMEQWQQIEFQVVLPQVRYMIEELNEFMVGNLGKKWEDWRERYLPAIQQLLVAYRAECAVRSQKMSDTVTVKIDPLIPESWRSRPLSQKALAALIYSEGVTCVLNGMRRKAYVEDALATWDLEPVKIPKTVFENFRMDN